MESFGESTAGSSASHRWALVATTIFVVVTMAHSFVWAVCLSLPILCATYGVSRFRESVRQRWEAQGYLLLADTLLVTFAIAGTGGAGAVGLLGLLAVALLATLGGHRRKTILACCWGLLALLALGVLRLAPVAPIDAIYAPMLLAAAFHFGWLGERLAGPDREVQRARRESRELWTLLDITDTITSSLDVGQVMRAIVEQIGDHVDAPSCSILVADARKPDGYVLASKGHPDVNMLELDLEKYPEVRQALRTSRPVVIDDVATDPLVAPVREHLLSQGHRSMLVVPLLFGREVLGALFLKSARHSPFPPAVLRFCKVAAGVSANALKNATLFRDVRDEAARHQTTGEKLRRVLDGTPDMIVATDRAHRVTQFNHGACVLTGITEEAALGRPLDDVLAQSLSIDAGAADVTLRRGEGDTVEVSLISAALEGMDGDPVGRVWIGRDVTKLRRVERSLMQAERLSSLGEVVAGVAHELNNPLSAVVGYAELLRSNGDPEQIGDLQRIVESAMRCQKIVFKLLSFARKRPPEKRYQSLNDCVERVLDLKSYQLRSSQIETVVRLDPDLPCTSFDRYQIEQVFLNLMNNAEQAMLSVKRTGRLELRSRMHDGQICLEVRDDGPGIPASVREKIFDPFFTTKPFGQGTGLGLSVSYGIVQEHAGSIELDDAPATCFRVLLPVVAGEEPEAVEPADPLEAGARPLAGKQILVAEDEPMVLELFARVLKEEGAGVTLARDGEEAWEALACGSFDLVVADLRMPNVSGQQLYERVAEERPDLLRRFVFATGDLARNETLSFLDGLPNRILAKPLEIETVRRVLAQALEAAA